MLEIDPLKQKKKHWGRGGLLCIHEYHQDDVHAHSTKVLVKVNKWLQPIIARMLDPNKCVHYLEILPSLECVHPPLS